MSTRALAAALATLLTASLLGGCLAFHPQPLAEAPTDATFVQVGATRVHVVEARPAGQTAAGPQQTVVLLHGFGSSASEWRPLLPALADAGYRAIALDLRGHGWTTREEGDYSIAAQAELAHQVLDQLGVQQFALVGHSWGSAVALALTLRVPERVSRLVLLNGMFFDSQRPTLFSWARLPGMGELVVGAFYRERLDERAALAFYEPREHVTEAMVEEIEAYVDRPGTLAATLAGLRAMDFSELELGYPHVKQPVLVLWGREDEITPLQWGERLVNRLPNARLQVIPRCGHMPQIEWPVATRGAVLRFLAEAER